MVRAAVTEGELVRAVSGREAEQLMPEADPEDGYASEEVAHDPRLGRKRLGVARPVREDDAVVAGELVRRRRVWDDRHGCSCVGESPHDRALRPVVDHRDVRVAGLGEDVGLSRRHLRDESLALHRRLPAYLDERVLHRESRLVRDRRCAHGAAVAQAQDQRASVEPVEPDEAVLAEPPGPVVSTEGAHEHGAGVWLARLAARLGDSVVADHRGREAHELPGVARIGDGLLVAGHTRRENGFAEGDAVRGDGASAEDGPVVEHEEAGAHEPLSGS